jgi:hypothetical protein
MPLRGGGGKITDADIETAARDIGCEPAAVRAVAEIESSGSGFDRQGRPKILFEAHYFERLTGARYHTSHPHLSQPDYKSASTYYKTDQWGRLKEAMTLDEDAALKSASWGKFQIMGENYAMVGWSSIRDFVLAMFDSEGQHLRAFIAFCKSLGLGKALAQHDWEKFARSYNGPHYSDPDKVYHLKMAAAYERYSRR